MPRPELAAPTTSGDVKSLNAKCESSRVIQLVIDTASGKEYPRRRTKVFRTFVECIGPCGVGRSPSGYTVPGAMRLGERMMGNGPVDFPWLGKTRDEQCNKPSPWKARLCACISGTALP